MRSKVWCSERNRAQSASTLRSEGGYQRRKRRTCRPVQVLPLGRPLLGYASFDSPRPQLLTRGSRSRQLLKYLHFSHLPGVKILWLNCVTALHEKAGRSQVDSSLTSWSKVFFSRRVAAVAMLPSALSRSDSFRSVHVGRSRFSRCCHLFGALWFCFFRVEPGPRH